MLYCFSLYNLAKTVQPIKQSVWCVALISRIKSLFCTNIQYLVCCFPGKLSHSEEIKGCRKLISHIVAFLICSSVTAFMHILLYIWNLYYCISPNILTCIFFLMFDMEKKIVFVNQVSEWVYSESLLRPVLGITSSVSYVIGLLFQITSHSLFGSCLCCVVNWLSWLFIWFHHVQVCVSPT